MGQQSGIAVVELHTDLTQAGGVTRSGLRQGTGVHNGPAALDHDDPAGRVRPRSRQPGLVRTPVRDAVDSGTAQRR